MYLHKLEKDERLVFLALAKRLARIDDNRIDARERYMLRSMCSEMGLSYDDTPTPPFDLEQAVKVFYRGEARRIVLLEAIGICMADGEFQPAQRELVEELAGRFRVGADFLPKAEKAVRKQLEVMGEFDDLIDVG